MCTLCPVKKSTNGCKRIYNKGDKKIIKHFAQKSFSVFKNAKKITWNTQFFVLEKCFIVFVEFMKNALASIC